MCEDSGLSSARSCESDSEEVTFQVKRGLQQQPQVRCHHAGLQMLEKPTAQAARTPLVRAPGIASHIDDGAILDRALLALTSVRVLSWIQTRLDQPCSLCRIELPLSPLLVVHMSWQPPYRQAAW